jgi:plasmid stabilization system protein ParE
MKYRLRIYPAANADVDNAAMFIAQDNISAALRFSDAVGKTFQQIREHPTCWPRFELDHPRLTTLRKCFGGGLPEIPDLLPKARR